MTPGKIDVKYKKIVKDVGDTHLFTSAENSKVHYLVSLDRKYILSLSKKIKKFKIITLGELIEKLENR